MKKTIFAAMLLIASLCSKATIYTTVKSLPVFQNINCKGPGFGCGSGTYDPAPLSIKYTYNTDTKQLSMEFSNADIARNPYLQKFLAGTTLTTTETMVLPADVKAAIKIPGTGNSTIPPGNYKLTKTEIGIIIVFVVLLPLGM